MSGDRASAEREADDVVAQARRARTWWGNERARIAQVRRERAAAAVALRSDGQNQASVLAALLVHERAATGAYLLTERARADDAVAHHDDFLGIVAHDLRNLLSGVMFSVEELQPASADAPDPQRAAGNRIRRDVMRMNPLIGSKRPEGPAPRTLYIEVNRRSTSGTDLGRERTGQRQSVLPHVASTGISLRSADLAGTRRVHLRAPTAAPPPTPARKRSSLPGRRFV